MKTQLDQTVEVLKYNFPIYLNRLIKQYIDKDLYEDLGDLIYRIDDDISSFRDMMGLTIEKYKELSETAKRMRSRKYVWESTSKRGFYGKAAVTKDNKIIDESVKIFRRTNTQIRLERIKFNDSVTTLTKMFKLNTRQKELLQFLFDIELAYESRTHKQEYYCLIGLYEVRPMFKNNLYELLKIYVKDVDRKDVEELVEKGIVIEHEEGLIEIIDSDLKITPYWPVLQRIYKRLIVQNKPLEFDSITTYFQDQFKRKLTYKDFKDSKHTPIIEKLVNKSLEERTEGVNILFYGQPGTGKTEMVHALAEQNNWKLIVLGENDDQDPVVRLWDLKFAQTFFKNFKNEKIVFLFDEMEDLLNIKREDFSKNQINRLLENCPFPVFWTTNNVTEFDQSFLRRMVYATKFEIPGKRQRKKLWNKFSDENKLSLDKETLDSFAENYYTAPSIINSVAEVANKAQLKTGETKTVIEGLLTAYNFGQEPKVSKDAYVGEFIPYDFKLANTDADLKVIMDRLETSKKLNWSMVLHGAPGTGKSAYARHLAKVLGIKVIFKRASDLVSMWVGETEHNIARAFAEAADDEAMLIIDEADSFLHSRKNARAQYEISAVNEMLTQMESAKHPFICTTNLIENLDEASMRRFVFKVKFNWMTTEQIELAFKEFFNLDLVVPKHWQLSPGDFVAVKKRTDIIGTTDLDEIFNLVKNEFEIKKLDGGKPIGFGR